ncbi:unnamed protein product, partial [Lymnaea stagnalis]
LSAFLEPGDVIMADRGFTIEDNLLPMKVTLVIPPFLKNKKRLTPQEELKTKQIAKLGIHIERAIEAMKRYKILQYRVPLSIQYVFSQMVFV